MITKNHINVSVGNAAALRTVVLFCVFGGLVAAILSSCQEVPQIGSGSVANSNEIPLNGPYEITLSKDTCVKFGREIPAKFCAPQTKEDQCWLGSGSLLTVRVLYQASDVGSDKDKYLSFQVADGVTNTLSSKTQSNPDISDTVPCSANLINSRMTKDKSVSFIWSAAIDKITDKTKGKVISLDEVAKPPTRSVSSVFQVSKGTFTSGYGWRWGRMHRGIDIAADSGTPIFAYCSGRVQFAGANDGKFDGYGNIVELRHNDMECNGVGYTRYAHNSSLLVKTGDTVQAGQQISRMGSTGRSTGPHLHFETRNREDVAFNPLKVLTKDGSKRHPVLQFFQNFWIEKLEKLAPAWDKVSLRSSQDLSATRDVLARVLGFRLAEGQPPEIATIQADEGPSFALTGSSQDRASDYLTPTIQAFGNRRAVLVRYGKTEVALEIDLEGDEPPGR